VIVLFTPSHSHAGVALIDPTNRRRFAFRLRTLIIIVTLIGLALFPVAAKVQKAREQKRTVAWVLANGGVVGYDWQSQESDATSPTGPKWLRRLLGDEFFQTVQRVNLNHTRVDDLAPLRKLTSLRQLYLWHTPVHDLSPLQGLTNLQQLHLGHTQVGPIQFQGLTELRVLDLSGATVSDLSSLATLTKLQILYVSGTQVGDLSPLRRLAGLKCLRLERTHVRDLSPLSRLTKLVELRLERTQVSDLAPLKALTELRRVYLSGTQVRDLSPLTKLSRLTSLYLYNTRVSDDQVARLQKALPKCKVRR